MTFWVRPQRRNDWGTVYFVASRQKAEMHSARRDKNIRLNPGERLMVRWPDGSETLEKLGCYRQDVTVGDMGHYYDVSSEVPCLFVDVRGAKARCDLDESAVRVWSLD